MKINKIKILLLIALSFFCSFSLQAQNLYVGANYHPHDDKNLEKIKKDISLMKAAGLTVVRLGHLAWDSYEPSEGKLGRD
jgi:beta-galactosidase